MRVHVFYGEVCEEKWVEVVITEEAFVTIFIGLSCSFSLCECNGGANVNLARD